MKKKFIFKILTMFIFVLALICGTVFGNGLVVNAESLENNQNNIVSNNYNAELDLDDVEIEQNSGLISVALWNSLSRVYTSKYGVLPNNVLKIDSFVGYYDDTVADENRIFDISMRNLTEIDGLEIFDLSAFRVFNLSGNFIEDVDDGLTEIKNAIEINLSNNKIKSFSKENLSEQVYKNAQTIINLKNNNIEEANILDFEVNTINLENNFLKSDKLVLPTNQNVKVNLSHNLLADLVTENANISLGFQGVKNEDRINKTDIIKFFGLNEITEITILKNGTEYKKLGVNESTTFPIGAYTVKFTTESSADTLLADINFKILPSKPTAKMFQNGNEIEFSYKLTDGYTLKFEGEEGAEIYCKVNNNEVIKTNEITITEDGASYIRVFQIVDGIESEVVSYVIQINKSTMFSWFIVLGGMVIFALLFVVAIKVTQKIKVKKVYNNKKIDLD